MAISSHRIYAVMLRYLFSEKRNLLRLSDALYWPFMDIALWGLTTTWMAQQQVQLPHIVLVILTGLVLWQVVMRAHYEITIPLMEEMWSRSFVSLFSTPLTIWEWLIGVMINGFIKTFFVLLFGAFLVWIMYSLSIFTVGWMLLPFVLSLIMFGWVIGLWGASIIVYYGQKAQNLPWMMAFLFAPVSGVYYPIDVLPVWMQKFAYMLPVPYIFEGMRKVLFHGVVPVREIVMSYAINACYLVGSILLFVYMFEKSRTHGFDRL